MSGINISRWLLGGLAAAVLIWLVEGAGAMLYMGDMQEAMNQHGLVMELGIGSWVISVVVSLVTGLALVFFYAACRPRFGPGPRTAVIVALALWVGGYLISLFGYLMLGLFPTRMLVTWGALGLVEMILASWLGAAIYREA